MRAPVNKLKKADMVWLGTHFCRHSHTYLEHYSCFKDEQPDDAPEIKEEIGFLDIEASNLHATFGYIFSYALKQLDGKLYGRVLHPSEITNYNFDKQLMREFLEDLRHFDRVVVYFGKDRRYDIPFLRSRCLRYNLGFPGWKDLYITDCYDLVKAKLRLHRNRLESACQFLGIPHKAHPMSPDQWIRAMAGCPESLDYIWKHNVEDAISLELLWKRLHEFGSNYKTSI